MKTQNINPFIKRYLDDDNDQGSGGGEGSEGGQDSNTEGSAG